MTLSQSEVKFLHFSLLSHFNWALTELSRLFSLKRKNNGDKKKKKGKEIRTEVVTWLLRPTRCFKPSFNSYFITYLCALFSYGSATLARLLFLEDTWPLTP